MLLLQASDSIKKLILFTSSSDGINPNNNLIDHCKNCYNQTPNAFGQQYLQRTLQVDFGCMISISSGLITAL